MPTAQTRVGAARPVVPDLGAKMKQVFQAAEAKMRRHDDDDGLEDARRRCWEEINRLKETLAEKRRMREARLKARCAPEDLESTPFKD